MLTRTAATTCLLLALAAAQTAGQRSILVTVIPEGTGPVRDLSTADFVVTERDTARQVLDASPAREPLFISVLVDAAQQMSGSTMLMRDLRTALAAFVRSIRDVEPGAKISLSEVMGSATIRAGFDAPASELTSAIEKLYPIHPGDTIMLESVGQTAQLLSDKPTPRRAIVVVDFSSSESRSESTMRRVVQQLHASGATVWAISTRAARSSNSSREAGLNILTKGSGGMRLTALETTGLEANLKKIADALTSQYIVTIARPDGPLNIANLQMRTTKGTKVLPSPMMR